MQRKVQWVCYFKNILDLTVVFPKNYFITNSFEQMNNYAGNMLEVKNKEGKRFLIMSQTAFNCLNEEQKNYLGKECTILHPKIEFVEVNGGGSARCMMAELF